MSKVYYTSDLHFRHELVSKIRDYDSTEAHDEVVFSSIIDDLKTGDSLYILGDLSIKGSRGHLSEIMHTLAQSKADLHLISGNHDPIHPMNRNSHTFFDLYRIAFKSVQSVASKRLVSKDGKTSVGFLLSHFPYNGEGERDMQDRHTQFRLVDQRIPILHGHTHSSRIVTRSDQNTVQIHVGWDAWEGLVDSEDIFAIAETAGLTRNHKS